MRSMQSLFGVLCVSFVGLAVAHAHLEKTIPSDGATLQVAPREFRLRFAEPVRLTALTLQRQTGEPRKLPLPGGDAQREFTLAVPNLEAGHYQLSWRVLSDDGHVMPGKISFTIGPQAH
ncbi:MAG: copper resistance protein CopC [Sinobacteraceae bacterium]|nr:copper resistance protein CopC [Nevskiaceae bacterium]MBV9914581.1 copper resistance protein CopC [Nevskiaceae bacterium]